MIDSLCDRQEGKVTSPLIGVAMNEFSGYPIQTGCRRVKLVPGEIEQAYEDRKEVIGRLGSLKILETTASKKPSFICRNAFDEYGVSLLNSLNKIPQMSPGAQILVTERQHIQDHIKKRHSRSATTICITLR